MKRSKQPKSNKIIASKKRLAFVILVSLTFLITAIGATFLFWPQPQAEAPSSPARDNSPAPTTSKSEESYKGVVTEIASRFSVKVPNGWNASTSETPAFTAIMFSKLDELDSLAYQADVAPIITQGNTPVWNGLTEHFFILLPTTSQRFDPNAHLEISSTAFTFDDGHTSTKFDVVKHAEEAEKWGGLKRDSEWQGRTYIYETDDERIEAHLALYPSTNVDITFYENVVRTIRPTK